MANRLALAMRAARWAVPGWGRRGRICNYASSALALLRRAASLRWLPDFGKALLTTALVTRAWRAGPSPGGDGEEDCKTAGLVFGCFYGVRRRCAGCGERFYAERKTDAVFEVPFYALRGWGFFLPIPAGMGQHSSECVLRGGNCCGDEYWQHTANRLAPVTRARRAGPSTAGDGEEGFAITQVLVWPLLWCAAPLRWPLFGTAFHSAVQPRLCSGRLRFAGRRTSARRFLRPRCDARMARWAVPIPARSAPVRRRVGGKGRAQALPRPRAQRAGAPGCLGAPAEWPWQPQSGAFGVPLFLASKGVQGG